MQEKFEPDVCGHCVMRVDMVTCQFGSSDGNRNLCNSLPINSQTYSPE